MSALSVDAIQMIGNYCVDNHGFSCVFLDKAPVDFDEFIEYALHHSENGALEFYLQESPVITFDVASKIAQMGAIDCLKILWHRFGRWPIGATYEAAIHGQTKCLEILLQTGARVMNRVFVETARTPHSECLRLLLPHIKPRTSYRHLAAKAAAEFGQLGCIEVCGVYTTKVAEIAAQHGHVDVMRHVLVEYRRTIHSGSIAEHNAKWSKALYSVHRAAVLAHQYAVVDALAEFVNIYDDSVEFAAFLMDAYVLQTIRHRICPDTEIDPNEKRYDISAAANGLHEVPVECVTPWCFGMAIYEDNPALCEMRCHLYDNRDLMVKIVENQKIALFRAFNPLIQHNQQSSLYGRIAEIGNVDFLRVIVDTFDVGSLFHFFSRGSTNPAALEYMLQVLPTLVESKYLLQHSIKNVECVKVLHKIGYSYFIMWDNFKKDVTYDSFVYLMEIAGSALTSYPSEGPIMKDLRYIKMAIMDKLLKQKAIIKPLLKPTHTHLCLSALKLMHRCGGIDQCVIDNLKHFKKDERVLEFVSIKH